MFLHTVAMEGPLRETIADGCLREIDWERGNPYIYRKDDYDMLVNSKKLFARKFSSEVDKSVIDQVFSNITSKEKESNG